MSEDIESEDIGEIVSKSLLAYATLINETYQTPAHLIRLAKLLESVERGEKKRVIVTIPPRHGKSMLCSTYFPAWYLGKHPDKYIITATYGQELSDDFGRAVRNQVKDPLFTSIFPSCKMRDDSHAANRFNTGEGGSYFAVGAGGAITGRGAHLLLIDDPIKNREEAESETVRRKIKDWYRSVAYTRLMPGGSVFVISTRWHQDDLAGWLQDEHGHEKWEIINLRAIDEDGQALWPEAYPIERLQSIRQTLGEYEFQSLYQQNPIAKEAAIIKPEWIKPTDSQPIYAFRVTTVDPAISEKEDSDETVIKTIGVEFDTNRIHEIETVAGHWSFGETVKQIQAAYARHKPDMLGIESVAFQRAFAEVLREKGIYAVELKADHDKVRRAHSVSHLFEQDMVRVNDQKTQEQLIAFPNGRHDDRVDTLVYGLRMIIQYSKQNFFTPRESSELKTYDQRVRDFMHKRRERIAKQRKGQGIDSTLGGQW